MSGFVAIGIFFAAGLAAGRGSTDVSPQASSLSRALALLASADANHDRKLSPEETKAIPVSAEAFGAEDVDRDGAWSRDEFLVFYRHQLVASRQPVGTDLEAEITRIQALRRVESVDESKKPKCETSAKSADAGSVNQRFETILAEVEAKCAARRAGRDDFQRLRNLVVLNGRTASRDSKPPSAETQTAMLAAIDRIEKGSAQGQVAKEDFALLRGSTAPGSRNAVSKPKAAVPTEAPKRAAPPPNSTPPSSPPPQAGPAAARQRPVQAPPAPKPKARPSPAPPRPAPAPPRDPPDRTKP